MKPFLLLAKSPRDPKPMLSYRCPWCLRETSSQLAALYGQGAESFHNAVCGHPICGKPVLVYHQSALGEPWALHQAGNGYTLRVYPPTLPDYSVDGVPENIARDFTEALHCQASGFLLGAALVGRRVLQAAIRDRDGKGKDLKEEIDSLPPELLSNLYKDQAHQVRFVGNDAAHADHVTPDEVEDLIEFTSQVLNQLYFMPERVRLADERRKAKKSQATRTN